MTEKESIFLKALNNEVLPVPPIWYMRQAGRYMPEYRAVRKKFKNFLDMCKNPEVCCELALQPINAFELDSAILFSDILTIPDAMGLDVKFLEGEGPVFGNPVKTAKDVINIEPFDSEKLSYVYKAVENIRRSLPRNIPLIGFCGSPWTLAAYSIEGRSSKDFLFTRNFLKENNVDLFLVGMPLDLRGEPTDSTAITKSFIAKLSSQFSSIKIDTYDERYTSKIAKDSLIFLGKNKKYRRKKSNIDKVSASLILQSYLIRNS